MKTSIRRFLVVAVLLACQNAAVSELSALVGDMHSSDSIGRTTIVNRRSGPALLVQLVRAIVLSAAVSASARRTRRPPKIGAGFRTLSTGGLLLRAMNESIFGGLAADLSAPGPLVRGMQGFESALPTVVQHLAGLPLVVQVILAVGVAMSSVVIALRPVLRDFVKAQAERQRAAAEMKSAARRKRRRPPAGVPGSQPPGANG